EARRAVVFDEEIARPQGSGGSGVAYELSLDWCLALDEEVGFALLRADGEPGRTALGGSERSGAVRGWGEPASNASLGPQIGIFGHAGDRQKIAIVPPLGTNARGRTLLGTVPPAEGPCFDLRWQLVGLVAHEAGAAVLVPWDEILASLRARG